MRLPKSSWAAIPRIVVSFTYTGLARSVVAGKKVSIRPQDHRIYYRSPTWNAEA
jgi:hypothetical protein